jgi:hypothetical protein
MVVVLSYCGVRVGRGPARRRCAGSCAHAPAAWVRGVRAPGSRGAVEREPVARAAGSSEDGVRECVAEPGPLAEVALEGTEDPPEGVEGRHLVVQHDLEPMAGLFRAGEERVILAGILDHEAGLAVAVAFGAGEVGLKAEAIAEAAIVGRGLGGAAGLGGALPGIEGLAVLARRAPLEGVAAAVAMPAGADMDGDEVVRVGADDGGVVLHQIVDLHARRGPGFGLQRADPRDDISPVQQPRGGDRRALRGIAGGDGGGAGVAPRVGHAGEAERLLALDGGLVVHHRASVGLAGVVGADSGGPSCGGACNRESVSGVVGVQ